ncbi:MAG: type I pantothenate kinase [Alphaproteobacteria bacterium]|nr:type I pantothenate kinase [Alphaproteobacteria bacterium]
MPGTEAILSEILKWRPARPPFVIGVAGSVAVGKSTFTRTLGQAIAALPDGLKVEIVSTDGFLFPNSVLAERGLRRRKGFPESFDVEALRKAVAAIRRGEHVEVPLYSHFTYDVNREKVHAVSAPDVVVLDGLHLARIEESGSPRLIDCLVYLDAEEASIEKWFIDRLLPLMVAGVDNPNSFYYAYRDFDEPKRVEFARNAWAKINLPNLRNHITDDRAAADLVLKKAPDHSVVEITAARLDDLRI